MARKSEQNEVVEFVRKAKEDYITGKTTISKYVDFSQHENIEKVDAYLNSRHTSGLLDSQGREKPFFNIVTAAVNIWYRATSTVRSRIRIKATKQKQTTLAFVATMLIQQWMRKHNFDEFLDRWDLTEARYGSAVLKFVEKGGDLIPSVIPWNRLISDTIDFKNNPKIEILWLTPAQLLKNKAYDQDMVRKLLDTQESRETMDDQRKDNKSEYIELYEVHGEMPLSYLTGKDKDKDEYVQQMHVVTFIVRKETGKYDDFCLYSGREAKDPYMITTLIEEDGRALGIGAVEHLFESQWMVNHTAKSIKDQLDLSSKLIFQTSDGNLAGQNILTSIENGDLLLHAQGSPITHVDNRANDITSLQNFSTQWQVLAKEITSTPDAIAGNTQPSGTPFRSVAVANQEAHSLFEVMKRNKKRDVTQMMVEYIVPHIKKKMDTSEEIAALLESQDINQLDRMYVPSEANKRDNEQLKKAILNEEVGYNLDHKVLENNIQEELNQQGNQRFIKPSEIPDVTWKQLLKDLEWDVEYEIVDKASDDQIIADTLVDLFKTLVDPNAQMLLKTPQGKMVFNKILEKTNAISPIELAQTPEQTIQPPIGGGSPAEPVKQGATSGGNSQGTPAQY